MANIYTKKPNIIYGDTSGTAILAEEGRIQSICITSGTANSRCKILYGTASNGSAICDVKVLNGDMGVINFIEPLRVPGLFLNTQTALSTVIVYLAPSDRPYL